MSHNWKKNATRSERIIAYMGLAWLVVAGLNGIAGLVLFFMDRDTTELQASMLTLVAGGMAHCALALVFFIARRTDERLTALEAA